MGFLTLFFLAIGLSMDAFAVSVSNGICYGKMRRREGVITAISFGAFQGIMPIIGYFAGMGFSDAMTKVDHWIALGVLGFIGGKMVFGAVSELRNPEEVAATKEFSYKTLFIQSIATSIDALAVGVSFAAINVDIFSAAALIAGVTAVCCLVGVRVGKKLGDVLKQRAEILGGVILVAIALKIFIEHTV